MDCTIYSLIKCVEPDLLAKKRPLMFHVEHPRTVMDPHEEIDKQRITRTIECLFS